MAGFQAQIKRSLWEFRGWVQDNFHVTRGKQLRVVNTATDKVLSPDTATVGATVLSVSGMLLFLVFTFIYSFLFLLYRSLIMKFMESVFLKENNATVHAIVEQVQGIIRKYIIGILIQMAIMSTVIGVAFSVMGVKYAILLGLLAGVFNVVPYIGILTVLVISAIVSLGTSPDSSQAVWVMSTVVIMHLVDSNVVLPLVVGSKVRINAFMTILGVVVGEMIWGIPGMFLSIPVIAVLKIVFDQVESLQPWGIILGDEERKQNKLATRLMVRNKKIKVKEAAG